MEKKRDRTEYNRKWYLAHKETENAGSQKYYAENTERCKKLSRNWRKSNPEMVKAQKRRHTIKYIDKFVSRVRRWKSDEKRRFVEAYGGACTCCGETEITFLTCEHLDRELTKKHREIGLLGSQLYRVIRLEGYPKDKYTVLCMNCNFARKEGKSCPHESFKEGLREIAG
jgi:hypothetical protein